jgi:outer membrane translocation and assembly module TamA
VFTPIRGSYIDLTVPQFRESWGSDRDFTKGSLTGMWFHPVSKTLFFGVRGTVNYSSEDTPFYLKPGIIQRGVEAVKYQGDDTAEVEAELRWQFNPRFSLVGFAGTGTARNEIRGRTRSKTVYSGGGASAASSHAATASR